MRQQTDAFIVGLGVRRTSRPDGLIESRSEVTIDWGDDDDEPPSIATDSPAAVSAAAGPSAGSDAGGPTTGGAAPATPGS